MNAMGPGRLATAEVALDFILAGNATFTVRSTKTQNRFTYKVKAVPDKSDFWFVALMSGPDNEVSFQYLGTIRNRDFQLGRKSRINRTAPSFLAFDWFWKNVAHAKALPSSVEAWHEGKCGMCNRKLTVPESIERGIGPECNKRFVSHGKRLL